MRSLLPKNEVAFIPWYVSKIYKESFYEPFALPEMRNTETSSLRLSEMRIHPTAQRCCRANDPDDACPVGSRRYSI